MNVTAAHICMRSNFHLVILWLQNTYEESLINVANRKGGLNEAILGNLASSNSEDPHENAAVISRLLKEGAHSLLGGKYALLHMWWFLTLQCLCTVYLMRCYS